MEGRKENKGEGKEDVTENTEKDKVMSKKGKRNRKLKKREMKITAESNKRKGQKGSEQRRR